ncbi:hypothetical protein OG497_38005 [Streptomyces sp. NBC_01242]|uniref:hypothetical protein n=1 Tax=Streptomyces sp. NBC_01242 TaxID=2903795 RepID=UPI002252B692|nr:hypothetical protein [Streptomyces sp. NBC_01242]MCX4799654.1 hypothetical protein [Streptomyces sp. NBC_01242]
MSDVPYASDTSHAVCDICPSLRLPGGTFDVAPRPSRECPFDPATGWRFTAEKVPVCVHPDRVGLPAAPYASQALPLPWQTDPPGELSEVAGWLRSAVTSAPPHAVSEVIERASAQLRGLHPGVDVTAALRAALAG